MATQLSTGSFGLSFPSQNNTGSGRFPVFSNEQIRNVQLNRIINAIGIDNVGTALINDAAVGNLSVGNGKDIEINGTNVSILAESNSSLSKMVDVGEEIKRREETLILSAASEIDVTIITTLIATYKDQRNTYAFIKDEYFDENGILVRTDKYVAFTGIIYGTGFGSVFIPAFVTLNDDTTGTRYLVEKIISTKILGGSLKNMWRSSTQTPIMIVADYITEIDLTFAVEGADLGAFYQFNGATISMPNLVRIKGVTGNPVPVFTDCANLVNMKMPKLRHIENVIFGSNNPYLKTIEFPELSDLIETVFLANCPSIENLKLPSLALLKGCDYFCHKNIAMKYLTLPQVFDIRPHDFEIIDDETQKSINSEILQLRADYKMNRETSAMQYFLHGCRSLMNAYVDSDTVEKSNYNSPYDLKNVSVTQHGIDFTAYGHRLGEWKIEKGDMYGGAICSLEQLCNEQGLVIPVNVEGAVVTPAEGSEFTYLIEATYKTMVDGQDRSTVLPIDFRTALFNEVKVSRNSKLPDHLFDTTTPLRFCINPTSYTLIKQNLVDFIEQCLGDNQYYNFGFTE